MGSTRSIENYGTVGLVHHFSSMNRTALERIVKFSDELRVDPISALTWSHDSMVVAVAQQELASELLKLLEVGAFGGEPKMSLQILLTKRVLESHPADRSGKAGKDGLAAARLEVLIYVLNFIK